MKAYLPFKGGSIYGFGTIQLNDCKINKNIFKFVCDKGTILFNKVDDLQVKGILFVEELKQSELNKYERSHFKRN